MVKTPAVFAQTPVLSWIPDIPYYYETVRGISFFVDLFLLCLVFAELMKIAADQAKFKPRMGAIMGVILGAALTFALHGAGMRLLQNWVTGLFIALVVGTAVYKLAAPYWGKWRAFFFAVFLALVILALASPDLFREEMHGWLSLFILIGIIMIISGLLSGLLAGARKKKKGAPPTPPTPPTPTPPTPTPTPAPPTPPVIPPPTPPPPHPATPKYTPTPPAPTPPPDPPSPRRPEEPVLPPLPPVPGEDVMPVDLSPMFLAVKNQLNTGSCSAFAGSAMVEYVMNASLGRVEPEGDLSELFLWFHAREDRASNSGCYLHRIAEEVRNRGVCRELLWTFEHAGTGKYLRTPPADAYDDAPNQRVLKHAVVADDADQWSRALRAGNPLLTSIYVPVNFFAVRSNFYPAEEGGRSSGCHAIVVVGYHPQFPLAGGKTVKAFKIRNSWGTGWGENGYTWIPSDLLFRLRSSPARVFAGWQRGRPAPRPTPQPIPAPERRPAPEHTVGAYHGAANAAAQIAFETAQATERVAGALAKLTTSPDAQDAADRAVEFAEEAQNAMMSCRAERELLPAARLAVQTRSFAVSAARRARTAALEAARYFSTIKAKDAAASSSKACDAAKERLDRAEQALDEARTLLTTRGASPDVLTRLVQAGQDIRAAVAQVDTVAALVEAQGRTGA
jgi:hypothetical protein